MRATVTISLDSKTLAAARENARKARRSVSSEFECAMEDRLEGLARPGVNLTVCQSKKRGATPRKASKI